MAKRQAIPVAPYPCGLCAKKCEGPVDSILAMLALCDGCQAKRFATGTAARARAEQQEAQRAG